jgi:hypothetical protein
MRFRFKGLPLEPFEPLFAMSDDELAMKDIRRMIADEKPGFPCRITLEDAERGERVLLLSYPHQPAHSPYKASGPIFVRENARTMSDGAAVPPVLRNRLLSLRAYDPTGMMVDADVTDGSGVESLLSRLFARDDVANVHIHNARRGCFACYAERGS